jgi:hypothetical protein
MDLEEQGQKEEKHSPATVLAMAEQQSYSAAVTQEQDLLVDSSHSQDNNSSNKVEEVQSPDTAIHDDSGHESNMSTPELPLTPQEERSITPGTFYTFLLVSDRMCMSFNSI